MKQNQNKTLHPRMGLIVWLDSIILLVTHSGFAGSYFYDGNYDS
jgi:hypothetical protein